MLVSSLLRKKRHGHPLADAEIRFLIEGFCKGDVTDYQMSALAMAICAHGMDPRETATLTTAMWESGETLPRIEGGPPRVDKHSSGGLGDMVSLILAPLLAACDLHVPMISGRGLGLTGGTLDKLESIEGFRVHLTVPQSTRVLGDVGAFIVGASDTIAPADRELYALRDVTGTVESVALITASILSKKLAERLDALVMDIKVGSGAMMADQSQAMELARSLTRVGIRAGLPTAAILTDMDQPLGHSIGNAIEVNEAMDVLAGERGPVRELTVTLGATLLQRVGKARTESQAITMLEQRLDQGHARERFERMIRAQGGHLNGPLPLAPATVIPARRDGWLASLDCTTLGETIISMGGGRRRTGDSIDPRVGIRLHCRIGQPISQGQPLMTLHCDRNQTPQYVKILEEALEIGSAPVPARALIRKRLDFPDA